MTYRIVCTNQIPVNEPATHAHIVAVGVGSDSQRATQKLTLSEVLAAIDRGHAFYTVGPITGKTASVIAVGCDYCGRRIIKSTPDATKDNNLDYLRFCEWRAN